MHGKKSPLNAQAWDLPHHRLASTESHLQSNTSPLPFVRSLSRVYIQCYHPATRQMHQSHFSQDSAGFERGPPSAPPNIGGIPIMPMRRLGQSSFAITLIRGREAPRWIDLSTTRWSLERSRARRNPRKGEKMRRASGGHDALSVEWPPPPRSNVRSLLASRSGENCEAVTYRLPAIPSDPAIWTDRVLRWCTRRHPARRANVRFNLSHETRL